MSTTFGIRIPKKDLQGNSYMNVPSNIKEDGDYIIIPIAFRSNGIRFTNPIANLLLNEYTVIAMDNNNKGINTIGDIKEKILKQKII